MKTVYFYKSGLPTKPSSELFSAELEEKDLVLKQIRSKLFGFEVLQTYHIPLENVLDCGLVHDTEISAKSKSVMGRGLVGGFLLGPAGAVLGGMSGMESKKKRVSLFVISYVSSSTPDMMKSFVLDTKCSGFDIANIQFTTKAYKAAQKCPKSQLVTDFLAAHSGGIQNSDGSITL